MSHTQINGGFVLYTLADRVAL